jgi:hypothetical protein
LTCRWGREKIEKRSVGRRDEIKKFKFTRNEGGSAEAAWDGNFSINYESSSGLIKDILETRTGGGVFQKKKGKLQDCSKDESCKS